MGVEVKHYLLPTDQTRAPAIGELPLIVSALSKEGWIWNPDSPLLSEMEEAIVPTAAHQSGGIYRQPDNHRTLALPWPLTQPWLESHAADGLRIE